MRQFRFFINARSQINAYSKQGFSLIELMMALGILGILMTGFATYITSATRAQKAISVKMDRQDFRNLISISPSTSLSMPPQCLADFGSKLPAPNTWPATPTFNLPNTTVLNQYNTDGTIFAPLANLNTGVIFGTTTLRIASITVTGLDQAVALPVAPATAALKPISLRISVQPTDATLASLSTFIFPMNLTINQAGAITGCQISQNAAAAPAPAAPPTKALTYKDLPTGATAGYCSTMGGIPIPPATKGCGCEPGWASKMLSSSDFKCPCSQSFCGICQNQVFTCIKL
jgi:prepilin-type N-terminal cleavage/methylation domain-containing protein